MAPVDNKNIWVLVTLLMCLAAAVQGLPPNLVDTPPGGDIPPEGDTPLEGDTLPESISSEGDTPLQGEIGQVMACVFQCQNGKTPVKNPNHVPSYNGCGSYGANVDFLMCPYLITCCNYHDLCYDEFGPTREECDDFFYDCTQTRPSRRVTAEAHDICTAMGKTMYATVRTFGCPAYKSAQKNACICV